MTESSSIGPGQRALDLTLAILTLPVLLPLGLVIALLVLIDSPGGVLYRSRRIGVGGAPFDMLKFRSMRTDLSGPPISCEDDERLTPLGRFLAATRLDEIPQLINVVRGQMCLVGPRPELQEFVEAHPDEYRRILSLPPGLTGPSQLEYADEGRILAAATDRIRTYREEILPQKVRLDALYVDTRSAIGDLWILLRTALVPFLRLRLAIEDMRESSVRARTEAYQLLALAATAVLILGSFAHVA